MKFKALTKKISYHPYGLPSSYFVLWSNQIPTVLISQVGYVETLLDIHSKLEIHFWFFCQLISSRYWLLLKNVLCSRLNKMFHLWLTLFWNLIEKTKMAATMEDFERPKLEPDKYRYFGAPTRNPLICCICDDFYKNPTLLSCYHSFCAQCLTSRSNNGVVYCPLCGYVW